MAQIDKFLGGLDDLYFLLKSGVTTKNPDYLGEAGVVTKINAVIARPKSRGQPIEVNRT